MQPESRGLRPSPPHPKSPNFRCESALPNPRTPESSAKTLDGSLPAARVGPFLDEKRQWPQCQKMVSRGDVLEAGAPPHNAVVLRESVGPSTARLSDRSLASREYCIARSKPGDDSEVVDA